jgi:hypothetical protein
VIMGIVEPLSWLQRSKLFIRKSECGGTVLVSAHFSRIPKIFFLQPGPHGLLKIGGKLQSEKVVDRRNRGNRVAHKVFVVDIDR